MSLDKMFLGFLSAILVSVTVTNIWGSPDANTDELMKILGSGVTGIIGYMSKEVVDKVRNRAERTNISTSRNRPSAMEPPTLNG